MARQKIIAQKFGGTSVATVESRRAVVGHIRRAVSVGYRPVVVLSAMGRRGAPYATDTLLDLIHAEGEPVSPRDQDLIFHCGEIISVAIMSHLLKVSGLPAVGLTGGQAGIYTNGRYRRGKIVRIDPSRMLHHVETGEVPVITGGQGVTPDESEVNILGRGASDTSGVAVGVAVGAEKIEIFTDVPGVAIADPKIVPEAHFWDVISYRALIEMGIFGAKVMHPGAVLIGQKKGVPIVCRSTFSEGPGTLITEMQDESPLMGIPVMEPVNVLILPKESSKRFLAKDELYDTFGAVVIQDRGSGKPVMAVAPGWCKQLENALASKSVFPEAVLQEKGLVSLIGQSAFIAENFSRSESVLANLGVTAFLSEMTETRSSFVVSRGQASHVVCALYEAFAE